MGFVSHRVDRKEIKAGDHIYTWRTAFAYAHHGIYVGENKVVHFTTGEKGYKNIQDSCLTCPDCGFHKHGSGVILSCLDCFVGTGSLYLFQYGTSTYVHISRLRYGTCTIAKSDPPQEVIHRAMYLLQNGFGNYCLVMNNCEAFALYCKTSLLCRDPADGGISGQVYGWAMSPFTVAVSSAVKMFRCSTPLAAVLGTGMHCFSRYATDIGVRKDVVKVNVEDMALFRSRKKVKKSLVEDEITHGNKIE